jgi:hypothetical protein
MDARFVRANEVSEQKQVILQFIPSFAIHLVDFEMIFAIIQAVLVHLFSIRAKALFILLHLFYKLIIVCCIIYRPHCQSHANVSVHSLRYDVTLPCGMNSRNFPSISSAVSASPPEKEELTPWNLSE